MQQLPGGVCVVDAFDLPGGLPTGRITFQDVADEFVCEHRQIQR